MPTAKRVRLKLDTRTRRRFKRVRRLSQLRRMDPITFEHFVGYYYQQQGYRVYTTVASGDEGVDLYLRKGLRTGVVQVKRYSGTVGQPVVRDLYGAMVHNSARHAALVTSGTVSQAAERWAEDKPIDLIDGHELLSWTRRNRLGLSGLDVTWLMQAVGAILLVLLLCGGLYVARDTLAGFFEEGTPVPVVIPTNPPRSTLPATTTATETPTISPTATATPSPSPTATATATPTRPLLRPTLSPKSTLLATRLVPPATLESIPTRGISDN